MPPDILTPDELDHYRACGYVALRNFVADAEIAALRQEIDRLIAHAPVARGTAADTTGSPVAHPRDFAFSDGDGAQVLNRISRPLLHSDVVLRSYGHPRLLGAARDLYGDGLVPFAESIVIKLPQRGAPFAWHQDGSFKSGAVPERGVNFGLYLHEAREANGCLFVVPKSHEQGRIDISALIAAPGGRPRGAIPVEAAPGDVLVHSRNLIHGSFANTSPDPRVTVYFGYHARATVAGIYEEAHIERRRQAIALAVRRRQRSGLFPGEVPFDYPVDQVPAEEARDEVLQTPPLAV